jgi:FemAB-related protein (PEP-CTERM system-associated)
MTAADLHERGALPVVSPYAGESEAWDAYVHRTPGGTFFHLIGWKDVLEHIFGFPAHYLVARCGEEITGVLPLFELHAPLMERCLLSVPFGVDGGVCSADPAALQALDSAALALGRARGARYVELRDGREAPGFHLRDDRYARFRHALRADDAAELAALRPKRRYMIRLAQRNGLTARVDAADLPVLHDLYARTTRRLGTPVFPLRFFRALVDRFPDHTVILTVRRDGVPAAAALMLLFGDIAAPYYAGSRRDYFRYAVNDFLYWELMRYARRRGARVFDFGRSKVGSGPYTFKRLWGFEPEPVRYRVHDLAGAAVPERSSADANLRRIQQIWRHLPLPVTKLLGPIIVGRYGPYYT